MGACRRRSTPSPSPSVRPCAVRSRTCSGATTAPRSKRTLAFYRERFADVGLFENSPYEGIAEVLAALRESRATLLVATSKPRVYAERIVRHFGLDTHFTAVHGCELDGTREDKRDLLEHLLGHHGLAGAACVMVGDRDVDMRAARHHGAGALGALWGYGSRGELEQAGAHALCESPRDLPAALAALSRIAAPS
jgi:phosphoglycolate phosphatase